MSNLKQKYQKEIIPQLVKEFGFKNRLAVPKIEKVVINLGVGGGANDKGAIEQPSQDLALITGQRPKVAQARISVAGFKLRKGAPVGLVVTLRRQRMYAFLEKLFKIALPRLRDFQGVSPKSFDGRGNYSLGIPEYSVFPEIEHAKSEKGGGLEITIVTSVRENEKARRLLELFGMPFKKQQTT